MELEIRNADRREQMIGKVRIAATFDMYVNAGRSNSPLHSVFIEKYFAGMTSASHRKANAT